MDLEELNELEEAVVKSKVGLPKNWALHFGFNRESRPKEVSVWKNALKFALIELNGANTKKSIDMIDELVEAENYNQASVIKRMIKWFAKKGKERFLAITGRDHE